MVPRARARLGVAAALPALLLLPALPGPTTQPAVTAQAATGYEQPVPGPMARSFDPPARDWEAGHRGIDLWSAHGAEVRSPGTGVVTFAGSVAGKPVVVVTHPDGLRSSLEPVVADVPQGTAVAAGDVVGHLAPASATASNPDHCTTLAPPAGGAACVHWGVRRAEQYLDPLALLGDAGPIVLLPPR